METQSRSRSRFYSYGYLVSRGSKETPKPDERYAEELQLEEVIKASLITSSTRRSDSVREKSKEIGESSQSSCGMCHKRKDRDRLVVVRGCSHRICDKCIAKYINAAISSRETSRALTFPDSRRIPDRDVCRGIVPKHVTDKNGVIRKSTANPSVKLCSPHKDSASAVIDNREEVIVLEVAEETKDRRYHGSKFSVQKILECLLTACSGDELRSDEIPIANGEDAEEICFHEARNDSLLNLDSSHNDSASEKIKKTCESSQSSCEICTDRKDRGQMFPVQGCDHRFCITCITKYLKQQSRNLRL